MLLDLHWLSESSAASHSVGRGLRLGSRFRRPLARPTPRPTSPRPRRRLRSRRRSARRLTTDEGKRTSTGRRRLPAAERLLNRELSSLALVDRVLELAADPDQPLLERVRFCSIVSAILDELFMIRVAGFARPSGVGAYGSLGRRRLPRETLAEVREGVLAIGRAQSKLWAHDLRPALAEAGIVVGSVDDLSKKHRTALERRFGREIFPVLTPLGVGPDSRSRTSRRSR